MTTNQVIASKVTEMVAQTVVSADGVAYALRFAGVRLSRYDVLDVLETMPNVKRISYTLWARS